MRHLLCWYAAIEASSQTLRVLRGKNTRMRVRSPGGAADPPSRKSQFVGGADSPNTLLAACDEESFSEKPTHLIEDGFGICLNHPLRWRTRRDGGFAVRHLLCGAQRLKLRLKPSVFSVVKKQGRAFDRPRSGRPNFEMSQSVVARILRIRSWLLAMKSRFRRNRPT